MTMRTTTILALGAAVLMAMTSGCTQHRAWPGTPADPSDAYRWYGVHLFAPDSADVPLFNQAVAKALAPMGINVIVLEVSCKFEFESHPELRAANALSKADVRDLVVHCREHGIKIIPQYQCLGHQSWANQTTELLTAYPELDETPGVPASNEGIYCRSWCPLHPKVNPIVFALMDELIDAFEADALHVGMDEVFLIASDQCPRCRGQDPARLFAKAVNDYHEHLVDKRGVAMLMWGDRLLDDAVMQYGKWESSQNGTAPAVDMISRDIVICDWHYEPREDYPSVRYFQDKGFRVWPASWHRLDATKAMIDCARKGATDRLIGHLFCTWVPARPTAQALLGNDERSEDNAVAAVATMKQLMQELMESR